MIGQPSHAWVGVRALLTVFVACMPPSSTTTRCLCVCCKRSARQLQGSDLRIHVLIELLETLHATSVDGMVLTITLRPINVPDARLTWQSVEGVTGVEVAPRVA